MIRKDRPIHGNTVSKRALSLALIVFGLTLRSFGQALPDQPDPDFNEETLNSLADSLKADLEKGNVEMAQLRCIQLNIALLGFRKATPDWRTTGTIPQANDSRAAVEHWRADFATAMKAPDLKILFPDPEATAGLVPLAVEILESVQNRQYAIAEAKNSQLNKSIADLHVKLSEANLVERIAQDPDPVQRAYRENAYKLRHALYDDDIATAELLAPDVLRQSQLIKSQTSWKFINDYVGPNIYNAYDALGRAAFRRGDYDGAIYYLRQAAKTPPGDVNLATYGPSLKLAKELLDKGYSQEVVDFLIACKAFWKKPIVDQWVAVIQSAGRASLLPNASH